MSEKEKSAKSGDVVDTIGTLLLGSDRHGDSGRTVLSSVPLVFPA